MKGMSSLSHPSGPEPERVYWVRRGIVAVAVLATVALAGWVLSMLFGSSGTTASADPAPNNPSWASTPSPSPSASASPSPSASSSSPKASGTPSAVSLTAPSGKASSPAPHSSSPAPSHTATTPAGPLVCAAADVALKVSGATSVKSGSHTTLSVSFTNSGAATCRLDFSKTPLTLTIYSGTDRIWTSADCGSWVPTGVQTLAAGKAYTFKDEWPTLRSAPGCKLTTTYLQPGTYVATATIPGGQPAQLVMSLHA